MVASAIAKTRLAVVTTNNAMNETQAAVVLISAVSLMAVLWTGYYWGKYDSRSDPWTAWPAKPVGVFLHLAAIGGIVSGAGRLLILALS